MKKILKFLRAFNKAFLPLKIKVFLSLFFALAGVIYCVSPKPDLTGSILMAALIFAVARFFYRALKGELESSLMYWGEDSDGNIIWTFKNERKR